MGLRQKFYVDPEIQFPIILGLILIVTTQGLFVGWGFYRAILIAQDWNRPDQAMGFFKTVFLTIVPVVAVNFALGTWLSHKIAGPMVQMRHALKELARGNLEVEVRPRGGDFLQTLVQDLNRLIDTLRHLLYRDRAYALEVDAVLTECLSWLSKRPDVPAAARTQVQELLNHGKSRLSVINSHFMKGKSEAP